MTYSFRWFHVLSETRENILFSMKSSKGNIQDKQTPNAAGWENC